MVHDRFSQHVCATFGFGTQYHQPARRKSPPQLTAWNLATIRVSGIVHALVGGATMHCFGQRSSIVMHDNPRVSGKFPHRHGSSKRIFHGPQMPGDDHTQLSWVVRTLYLNRFNRLVDHTRLVLLLRCQHPFCFGLKHDDAISQGQ